jgi:hypothetical protein
LTGVTLARPRSRSARESASGTSGPP